MNKTALNSQKEKHSMLSLRRVTSNSKVLVAVIELFLSTLSLRRATIQPQAAVLVAAISIHALLAESDVKITPKPSARVYFYPRSPCGERLTKKHAASAFILFLSTLSLRRATVNRGLRTAHQHISIHALLAESDSR